MFRYLVLVWHAPDEQQSAAAELLSRRVRALSSRWQQVLDNRGMRAFCADMQPEALCCRVLPNKAGIVLGSVFERNCDVENDAPSRQAAFTETQADAIGGTHGRWLIEHCWGNYVAVLTERGSECRWVLKEPAGSLPCFHSSFQRVVVIFSCVSDWLDLELPRFSINRAYLRTRIFGIGEDQERSPLVGVEQVRRGECVELDPAAEPAARRSIFYWNPLSFTQSTDVLEDSDRAARAIRATVRACTHSLASGHESLLHRLSGGLDSSIIAACLKDAPTKPRIRCYTYYNPRGRSDERPWARLAVKHAGHEHVECALRPADIPLQEVLRLPSLVGPTPVMGYLQRSTIEHSIAAQSGATAVFTGDGGDSGFCSDSQNYAALDFLRRHGIRPRVVRIAAQIALRAERSTWSVLLGSLRQWVFGSTMDEQKEALLLGSQLVSRDLRESMEISDHYPHPWFNRLDSVPWATIRRLGMLMCMPDFYNVPDARGLFPDVIAPLYSQPAVELFLRIPIYEHSENGIDRGLARRAFQRDVPQPILRRLWKDRAPGFYEELAHRNRDLLRELLLDGVLVREKLLDRTAIADALSDRPAKSTVLTVEVFRHLDIEMWARHWMLSR